MGLPAAHTQLLAGDVEVLVSQRFDRIRSEGEWKRLHQEDVCQALSVEPALKYQNDGGPGIARIAALLREVNRVGTDVNNARRFFDYLVFNVLIGATDAHAKNYSVFLGPTNASQAATLTPLYDVASIFPYDNGPSANSAMKIGQNWAIHRINDRDWAYTGKQLGLSSQESLYRLDQLRARIPAAFHTAAGEAGVPESLRAAAKRLADLVSANVAGKRDPQGNLVSS